jgi:hypothetical protein
VHPCFPCELGGRQVDRHMFVAPLRRLVWT